MREIPTLDPGARSFVFTDGDPQEHDCVLEFWPTWRGLRGAMPAEVHYFAGGPSSSTWIVPGTGTEI